MTGVSRTDAARLLRQWIEMGEVDLFFDGLDRAEVLRLVGQARSGAEAPAGARGPAAVVGTSSALRDRVPDRRQGGREYPSGSAPLGAPELSGLGSAPLVAPGPGTAPLGAPELSRSGTEPLVAPTPGTAQSAAPALSGSAIPSTTGTGRDLPVLPDDYGQLEALALGCTRCGLAQGRTQVVFSDGPPTARLMVVGEAPGATEDETGLPFVGAAGRFLDLLLATVGFSRADSVYICNVIKCRPPGNRNPMPAEIEACSPYLRKQIELVAPEAILAVGSFAAQLLTGQEKAALGKLRGEVHAYAGVPLVVTYHPAALLRNSGWTRSFWEDLQLLRGVLDAGDEEHAADVT